MHSGGFELTKLTYTSFEDNLIRHRGDRFIIIIKKKIHSSCEIEDCVENSSLQAVCDTPIARIIYFQVILL